VGYTGRGFQLRSWIAFRFPLSAAFRFPAPEKLCLRTWAVVVFNFPQSRSTWETPTGFGAQPALCAAEWPPDARGREDSAPKCLWRHKLLSWTSPLLATSWALSARDCARPVWHRRQRHTPAKGSTIRLAPALRSHRRTHRGIPGVLELVISLSSSRALIHLRRITVAEHHDKEVHDPR
jgi:hypothetical protein